MQRQRRIWPGRRWLFLKRVFATGVTITLYSFDLVQFFTQGGVHFA